MITAPLPDIAPKLVLRGLHRHLNDVAKASIEARAEQLFSHEPPILHLRVEIERAHGGATWLFAAKGHIEMTDRVLNASVTTEDAHKSVNLLIDKLDRMIRRRTTPLSPARHEDAVRASASHGSD